MDVIFIRKSIALIAKGLLEKERLLESQPSRYPHSKTLQHGINMFLYASMELGGVGSCLFAYADECSFLRKYAQLPIAQWFDDWDPQTVQRLNLEDEPFYGFGAFAHYLKSANQYRMSEECANFLETQEPNIIEGTDEHALYEKMICLPQDAYCEVRRFVIEHPILTADERREILTQFADNEGVKDAISFAYERFEGVGYACPACGWTLTVGRYGPVCHSEYCTKPIPDLGKAERIDGTTNEIFRLKKGIMRYFAQPGKLELEIVDFCEKKKLQWTLWPQKDRYDVEIDFSDGTVWEIDAKAYHNPVALRNKITQEGGLPEGEYQCGFFVIPTEFAKGDVQYTTIVNGALDLLNQPNVRCVTMNQLKSRINRKVGEIRAYAKEESLV